MAVGGGGTGSKAKGFSRGSLIRQSMTQERGCRKVLFLFWLCHRPLEGNSSPLSHTPMRSEYAESLPGNWRFLDCQRDNAHGALIIPKGRELGMARSGGPLTICVINLKGGVGKSTVAALLSRHAFSNRGMDVLAIDLDPQANLSQGLMHNDYDDFLKERRPSIVELFGGYMPPRKGSGPSPLAATEITETILETSDRSLQLIPSRFDFSDHLTESMRPDPKVLARFLSKNFKNKDVIFIDCSPTESVFTIAAYHASSYVLIPVRPEYFATIGFPLLAQSLDNFRRKNRGHEINVAGIIINNAFYHGGNDGGPEKTRAIREIRGEAAKNGWHIFKTQMDHSRGYPKIMRGDYSHSGNASNFWYFADEFFKHIGL